MPQATAPPTAPQLPLGVRRRAPDRPLWLQHAVTVDQGDPMTPEETVNAFIAAVTGGDAARAAELAADDNVYENIGFGVIPSRRPTPPSMGRARCSTFWPPAGPGAGSPPRDALGQRGHQRANGQAHFRRHEHRGTHCGGLRSGRREDHLLARLLRYAGAEGTNVGNLIEYERITADPRWTGHCLHSPCLDWHADWP